MSAENIPEHRSLVGTVIGLRAHVQWKIDNLDELIRMNGLNPAIAPKLRSYLEEELTRLKDLPDGTTLGELMDQHFSNAERVRRPFSIDRIETEARGI